MAVKEVNIARSKEAGLKVVGNAASWRVDNKKFRIDF